MGFRRNHRTLPLDRALCLPQWPITKLPLVDGDPVRHSILSIHRALRGLVFGNTPCLRNRPKSGISAVFISLVPGRTRHRFRHFPTRSAPNLAAPHHVSPNRGLVNGRRTGIEPIYYPSHCNYPGHHDHLGTDIVASKNSPVPWICLTYPDCASRRICRGSLDIP